MAPQNTKTVTDYELERLENIRRNAHKISSLRLNQKASDLSSSLKPKPALKKSKPETGSPTIPTRRSLRTRGVPASDSPDPPPPPMRDPLSIHSSLITLTSSASSPSDPGPPFSHTHSLSHSLMAPQNTKTVTDYELERLENIRRNAHKISSLLLLQKASDLSSSLKPKHALKKPKPETGSPIIPTRRSFRTRGVPPSDSPDPPPPPMRDPLSIHSSLLTLISSASSPSDPGPLKNSGFDPISELVLRPKHAVKLVKDLIMSVQFLPFTDREIIAVGNKIGDLGFWNANHQEGGDGVDNGVYVYHPHSSPVSGISVHHFSPQKIYSCGYDGLIRSMDVEKEVFSTVDSSDYSKLAICQWPNEANLVYVAEGVGYVKVWDERVGKASSVWELHERRINSIDFCSENVNLMLTSSTEGAACIWDLRNMKKGNAWGYESLKRIEHEGALHSAYFSPSGKFLATTSTEDEVGIVSGTNFDDISMVYHNNWNGSWLSSFRAIWGWDDSYLFLGNMKRAIDVISICDKTTRSLESPDMTKIPCRFAVHPYMLGHLAGTASGGKVFLWTKE